MIVVKTNRDIQLSNDCKSAKTIIANNADYTPAYAYALAAETIAEFGLRFYGGSLGNRSILH